MDRFSKTLLEETNHLAHPKGTNSKTSWLCTYLTENHPSLKCPLLYSKPLRKYY